MVGWSGKAWDKLGWAGRFQSDSLQLIRVGAFSRFFRSPAAKRFSPIQGSRPRLPARPGKHSEPDPPASYPGYSLLPNLFLSLRGFLTIPSSLGEPILPLENCTNSSKPIPASLDAYCSTSRFQDFSGGLELPPPHFLSRQPQPSPQAPCAPFGGVLFPGCPATFHRLIKRNKINPHYKSELRQTSNSRSGGCAHYSPARWQ